MCLLLQMSSLGCAPPLIVMETSLWVFPQTNKQTQVKTGNDSREIMSQLSRPITREVRGHFYCCMDNNNRIIKNILNNKYV